MAEYRKELPLSFLASKLMEKRASIIRAGSSCSNSISDGDDASLGSQGSSASSVVLDLDSSDVELMRLAVAKVVDGFTRMILDYYSFAWESLIAMRDHGRHKEKIRKAIRIQCWFRGFWSQLAVKRKKEQIRLEEERIARQRELAALIRTKKCILIQGLARRYLQRKEFLYFLKKNAAAKTIQRAWERRKVMNKGMNEVARYWFLQDSAVVLQCAWRSCKARVIFAHMKRGKRHNKMAERYATPGAVIRTNFEMQGAAAKIQRWFRRLPYRMRIMMFRARLRKARQIQHWWWHQRAKNSMIAKLLSFRSKIEARESAAKLIIPVVRGGVVRLRNKRIAKEAEDARLAEIEEKRILQKQLHAAERNRRHSALEKNSGFFGRFKSISMIEELNPMLMQKHKNAAITIQKHIRRILAIRIAGELRERKLQLSALRLQRKFKHYTFKKARWKATMALQLIWMKVKKRRRRKNMLVTRVQAAYRGMTDRRRVQAFVKVWNPTAIVIQRSIRGFLARKKIETLAQGMYWQAEFKMNGKLLYNNTLRDEIRRQIFYHTTHFRSPLHEAELQCIFAHYCSFGDRSNRERLGVNMFIKFIKDCDLITKKMNQQTFELLFTQEKGKETHLHYRHFVSALKSISDTKYPKVSRAVEITSLSPHLTSPHDITFFPVPTQTWLQNLTSFTPLTLLTVDLPEPSSLPQILAYGKYKGTNARLLKLLEEKIFIVKEIKKCTKELGEERADSRAKRHLNHCCAKIQQCWKDSVKRADWKNKFLSRDKALAGAMMLAALQTIQSAWRSAIGRYQMRKIGLKMYQKIIDDHHGGQVYYYNTKTGNASWKKPIFLGKYDIDNPIKLPSEDRLFKKVCDWCGKSSANWYDITGDENFCDACNEIVHSKNNKKDNVCVKIDNCVVCEFQVATKYCSHCKDMYCDTCFYDQHKKGMLQKHSFDEVQSHCDVCMKYVALLLVNPGDRKLCKVCYKKEYPWDVKFEQDESAGGGITVSPLEHHPAAVSAYYKRVEEEARKKRLEEEFTKRKARLEVVLRDKSALLIQRCFRGMKGRRRGLIIMASRRQARIQREKDELKRQRITYQIKLLFGTAPKLPSDTTMEKVLKRYPSRWAKLLTDVVDRDWEGAFNLIDEHEKYLALNNKGVSTLKKVKERVFILGYLLRVLYRRQIVRRLEKKKDKAQIKYRNARSAVGYDEEKKEGLKINMRKAKRRHSKEQEKVRVVHPKRWWRRVYTPINYLFPRSFLNHGTQHNSHSQVVIAPIKYPFTRNVRSLIKSRENWKEGRR